MDIGQNIKSALWGCFEIPLFMRKGVSRFENTKRAAFSSFLVPLLVLIPSAELAKLNPQFTGHSYFWIGGSFLIMFLISASLFYGSSYISMWALEKKKSIFAYINAFNWMNVTFFVVNLPFFLLVYFGIFKYEEMINLFIFLILFSCAYQAYFITRLLNINWMLGTAIAIMGLLADDLANKIMFGTS